MPNVFKINSLLIACAVLTLSVTAHALPKNMHLIDSSPNGFEIYRSSVPSTQDVREWCAMGIQEVYVLSGDAEAHELTHPEACPSLKIVYNHVQKAKIPLTPEFLDQFDQWVRDAQTQGKKILFRCSCGCHRTGRLAAYYRMKYNGWNTSHAYAELKHLAKWMLFYPFLKGEVRALGDYVQGKECGQKAKYCVPAYGSNPEQAETFDERESDEF